VLVVGVLVVALGDGLASPLEAPEVPAGSGLPGDGVSSVVPQDATPSMGSVRTQSHRVAFTLRLVARGSRAVT
jgi:hypothetical protein